MKHTNRLIFVLLTIVAGLVVACGPRSETTEKETPAIVEAIPGSEYNKVTLTQKAAERLDIQTAAIQKTQMNGATATVIPYAAVLYGLNGETWTYVNSAPLTYHRAPIVIDYIEGDMAVLVDGPPVGTEVVTVGVAELFGTDTGVGK